MPPAMVAFADRLVPPCLGPSPTPEMRPRPPRPREVVVLYSDRGPDVDAILRDRLRAAPGGVHLVTENLDLSRLEDADYKERLAGILQRKYRERHVDLVIPVYVPAIRFMAEQGPPPFPARPSSSAPRTRSGSRASRCPRSSPGSPVASPACPTVEAALGLQPETRRVVLVAGESPQDRYWRERVVKELAVLEGRVEIEAPRGLTMPELLDRLRELPDGTIVLFLTYTEDGAGSLYSTDAVRLVADASRVPVYVSTAQGVGSGAVGGYVFDHEREAEKAAGVALRVLRGERPEDIGVHEAPGLRVRLRLAAAPALEPSGEPPSGGKRSPVPAPVPVGPLSAARSWPAWP